MWGVATDVARCCKLQTRCQVHFENLPAQGFLLTLSCLPRLFPCPLSCLSVSFSGCVWLSLSPSLSCCKSTTCTTTRTLCPIAEWTTGCNQCMAVPLLVFALLYSRCNAPHGVQVHWTVNFASRLPKGCRGTPQSAFLPVSSFHRVYGVPHAPICCGLRSECGGPLICWRPWAAIWRNKIKRAPAGRAGFDWSRMCLNDENWIGFVYWCDVLPLPSCRTSANEYLDPCFGSFGCHFCLPVPPRIFGVLTRESSRVFRPAIPATSQSC